DRQTGKHRYLASKSALLWYQHRGVIALERCHAATQTHSNTAALQYDNIATQLRRSEQTFRRMQPQLRRAASIAAMSIFFICIIASNARLAAARSGSVTALVRTSGVICQDTPHLSLHQPHALSWPPLPTI